MPAPKYLEKEHSFNDHRKLQKLIGIQHDSQTDGEGYFRRTAGEIRELTAHSEETVPSKKRNIIFREQPEYPNEQFFSRYSIIFTALILLLAIRT